MKKFLDTSGVQHLWKQLSLKDYPNNETLVAVINAIDEEKANRDEIPTMDEIYAEISARLTNAEDVSF